MKKALLIFDMDGTLIGGPQQDIDELLAYLAQLNKTNPNIIWGIATGRVHDWALTGLKQNNIPEPQFLISGIGTQIATKANENDTFEPSQHWDSKVSEGWNKNQIIEDLKSLNIDHPRATKHENEYKLVYEGKFTDQQVVQVQQCLRNHGHDVQSLYSQERFLDIMPKTSGKAAAISSLAEQMNYQLSEIIVAGDSGNDRDMLELPEVKGIVVGNAFQELDDLRYKNNIYSANGEYAGGVLEGLTFFFQDQDI